MKDISGPIINGYYKYTGSIKVQKQAYQISQIFHEPHEPMSRVFSGKSFDFRYKCLQHKSIYLLWFLYFHHKSHRFCVHRLTVLQRATKVFMVVEPNKIYVTCLSPFQPQCNLKHILLSHK